MFRGLLQMCPGCVSWMCRRAGTPINRAFGGCLGVLDTDDTVFRRENRLYPKHAPRGAGGSMADGGCPLLTLFGYG